MTRADTARTRQNGRHDTQAQWPTIRQATLQIGGAGGTVHIDGTGTTWRVVLDAPAGMILNANAAHCYAVAGLGQDRPDWNAAVADLEGVLRQGFRPCTDPACDWCTGGAR